jgi:hypothetical protein
VVSFLRRLAARAPGFVGSPWTFLITIARTQLVRLEHLSDEEIDRIADEFAEIKEQQTRETG